MCVLTPTGTSGKTGPISEVRLHAQAIARLCRPGSGELVGYLYEWNTGECQPAWIGRPMTVFTVEPMDPAA